MDLIGDQSVQMVMASLRAAILLLSAMAALLLTARLATAARPPALAPQQFAGPYLCQGAHDEVGALLARCLPARAPPDLTRRNSLSPPGVLTPQ